MARIPLDTTTRSLPARLATGYSRRRLGKVADPLAAWAHHRGVMLTLIRLEMRVARWRRLDPKLQALAVMPAAARIGCSWCMDFGYWEFHHRGVDPRKLEDVPRWRNSTVYTDVERLVLEYAEAMTETPPPVTDEVVARLRQHLDDVSRYMACVTSSRRRAVLVDQAAETVETYDLVVAAGRASRR